MQIVQVVLPHFSQRKTESISWGFPHYPCTYLNVSPWQPTPSLLFCIRQSLPVSSCYGLIFVSPQNVYVEILKAL